MSDYFITGCVLVAFMFFFGGLGFLLWHDNETRSCEVGLVFVDEKEYDGCIPWEAVYGDS